MAALLFFSFGTAAIVAWHAPRGAALTGADWAAIRFTLWQAVDLFMRRPDAEEMAELRRKVKAAYEEQADIRYAAARLWVDAIIMPEQTRDVLSRALSIATRHDDGRPFKTGVLQV